MTVLDPLQPHPKTVQWMRLCHARFTAGERDDEVMRGHRAYQKWRKRVQRARGSAALRGSARNGAQLQTTGGGLNEGEAISPSPVHIREGAARRAENVAGGVA